MEVIIGLIQGILEQGLIYGIMALGVYISYSILDFPDLSIDGTFPLGAAISATLILSGVNPWLTLVIAFLCGSLCGSITGILHVKFGITDLLSGILMMTALYSVNLRIANKTAVFSIRDGQTIFNSGPAKMLPQSLSPYTVLIMALLIVVILKFLLDLYLKTKSGMLLRGTGDNKTVITTLGKNQGAVKILGLSIANGFAALSGAILCQQQRLFDINMGVGMIVMGLASVIIGISIFKKLSFIKVTTMAILGSIIYKACLSIALNVGLDPIDLKIVMAILFTIVLVFNGKLLKRRAK